MPAVKNKPVVETLRGKKLKEKIREGVGSLKEAAIAVGYSESYVESGRLKATEQYQYNEKDMLETIREKKRILIEAITKEKAEKEGVARLSGATKDLNHVEKLMAGEATDNVAFIIKRG